MKCDDPQEVLIEYVYEDLHGDQKIAVDRHLETCAQCRTGVETLRRTMMALDGWEPVDAPLDDRSIRRAIVSPGYWSAVTATPWMALPKACASMPRPFSARNTARFTLQMKSADAIGCAGLSA